jgi:hypothetical protein
MAKPFEIRHPYAACLLEQYVCQRGQSLGYTADLNSEDVRQLTDADLVEVVDADPTVSLTLDTNEFGSINMLNILAGLYGQDDNTNTFGSGFISSANLEEVATDIMVPINENHNTDGTTDRVLWFNNCFIDSISGSYQVDGFASESISLSGSNQRWLLNGYGGDILRVATFDSVSTLTITNGADFLDVHYVTEDGVILGDADWSFNDANDEIDSKGGYEFTAGSRYRVVGSPVTNTFPSTSDTASPIGGVKEGEIEVYLWDEDTEDAPSVGSATNRILRLQSVDYDLSFDRESLKQIYNGEYHKGVNETNITTSISLNDSDLEVWAKLSGNTFASSTSMSLADFQSMTNLSIRVDIFNTKEYADHDTTTLLKQLIFTGGKVTSTGDSRDVPGRGTQNFDLKFTSLLYRGTGLVGR